ncbi:hypothetical protein HMPREF3212_03460 [Citrobacter freundii]|nr:hypothetical protein HMPREF3212_03460 [Citrobacter freundii]
MVFSPFQLTVKARGLLVPRNGRNINTLLVKDFFCFRSKSQLFLCSYAGEGKTQEKLTPV